ncbi:ParA family protein [Spiribacter vilamensis]|nr:ParA family protein [Spiribacter vilamensis]
MTPVIALTSPKGGAGKTTLASHLGHSLQHRGQSVLLIDADPQESLLS